jgi:ADP-ribose pyrophosphatase
MRLKTREIYRGRVLDLDVDTIRLPNDEVLDLEIVRHRGAAAVVPVDAEGTVWMVRQYRYATGGFLLEIPAGKLDGGEAPDTCARRELEEEVGRRAGTLVPLGFIWTTPGFTDERIWLYLATDLDAAEQRLERDEWLTVERRPLEEALRLAENGTIADAKSVCALLRAGRRLGLR